MRLRSSVARLWLCPLLLLLLTMAVGWAGGIPNPADYVQKCVSGFCLPPNYEKLETPVKDTYTTVKVETEIMDVLQVSERIFIRLMQFRQIEPFFIFFSSPGKRQGVQRDPDHVFCCAVGRAEARDEQHGGRRPVDPH